MAADAAGEQPAGLDAGKTKAVADQHDGALCLLPGRHRSQAQQPRFRCHLQALLGGFSLGLLAGVPVVNEQPEACQQQRR